MRRGFVIAVLLLLAVGVGVAQETPSNVTEPRTLALDLAQIMELRETPGNAEFDVRERRIAWRDPMARLSLAVSREQWAGMRGGHAGSGVPWSAGISLGYRAGADPRLVFKGPWAEDWHDLTTAEKIGRAAEGAALAGLVVGILSALR